MRQVCQLGETTRGQVTVESHSDSPTLLYRICCRGLSSDRSDKNSRLTLISLCGMIHPHGYVDSTDRK